MLCWLGLWCGQPAWGHGGYGRFGGYPGGWRFGGGYYGGGYRGFGGVGLYYAQPWFSPWYFGPPTYYYPPALIVPTTPPVYIEQGLRQSPASESAWQYCPDTQAYYPFVRQCEGGWQSLPAHPEGMEASQWYYCGEPQGYYPYIRECQQPWQAVKPSRETQQE